MNGLNARQHAIKQLMKPDMTWHQSRAAESRRAILRAAEELFLSEGYKCSIDAIAAHAGISRRTLYLQFGSKELLFRAIVDELSTRLIAPLLKILESKLPLAETLERFALKMSELVFEPRSVKFLRLCIAEANQFPDLGARHYETGMNRILPALTRFLATRMDEGAIAKSDATLAAEQFLASVIGYRQYRALLRVPNPVDIPGEAYVKRAVATFIAANTATQRRTKS